MNACANCQFYKQDEDKPLGLCVRFPPQVSLIFPEPAMLAGGKPPIPVNHPLWPFVMNTDWCGEYREAVSEPKVVMQ